MNQGTVYFRGRSSKVVRILSMLVKTFIYKNVITFSDFSEFHPLPLENRTQRILVNFDSEVVKRQTC